MTPNEILDEMERIFPDARCELNHETPFQLLVAVVLSAQTTDAMVNRVTPDLFSRFPDCKSMAQADVSQIASCIRKIGLYRNKAKSISSLSKTLLEKYDGQVPSSYQALLKLPGVGRKTANVVRSVAFDIPSFAVDTHVNRVSKRLGLAKYSDSVEKVEEKLKRKMDRSRWNQAHHDFIFFGRYLCHSRNPECDRCPFSSFCKKNRYEK